MALEDYMVHPKYIYMRVTSDELELPDIIADSVEELARLCKVDQAIIYRSIRTQKRGFKSIYKRVRIARMTIVEEYREARARGESYAEIAKRFGVSRQAVWQALNRKKNNWQDISPVECVYPYLREWLNEKQVTIPDFAQMVQGTRQSGSNVRCWLEGTMYPSKKYIDKLLAVTGLTYEKLFEEDAK